MNKTKKERLDQVNKQIIQNDINMNGLTTQEIDEIMSLYYKDGYIGCIASNQIKSLLPKIKPKSRIAFVMNLSPISKKTGHWVAIFIDGREDGDYSFEYYDSLCVKPKAKFLKDMSSIIEKIDAGGYLTFKVNKIKDQSINSNNCGFFATKFLISRFRGKSFSEASGYNKHSKIEEMNIEKWKKKIGVEEFAHLYSGQNGLGFFSSIKNFAVSAFNRIKNFINGQRGHAGPYIRKYLEAYGTNQIISMKLCRKPIFSILENIGSYLSGGVYDQNKAKQNYDKMFHLFLLIKITDGKTIQTIKLEKNQIVQIKDTKWETDPTTNVIFVNVPAKLTLIDLFINGEKEAGGPQPFFNYNPLTTNCQNFVKMILKGCNMWKDELESFVMQDVKKTLEGLGFIEKIAVGATDLAGRLDGLVHGEGKNKKKKCKN